VNILVYPVDIFAFSGQTTYRGKHVAKVEHPPKLWTFEK